MKKVKRIARWLLLVTAIILFIFSYYMLSMQFHSSDAELRNELSANNINGLVTNYTHGTFPYQSSLRYVHIPNKLESAPVLLTLHGAPGSSSDYSSYWKDQKLREKFEIVSVDRPGYGVSSLNDNNQTIEEQAQMIGDLVLNVAPQRKVVILSHSYGGAIGARMAQNLDTLCIGHVMVAPIIDPLSEEVFWYSPIPVIPPFSWFASKDWKTAALEKKTHIKQLNALESSWHLTNNKTIHIHGSSDWLAPIENVEFAESRFDPKIYNPIIVEEGSHFILWEPEVMSIIKDQLFMLQRSDLN